MGVCTSRPGDVARHAQETEDRYRPPAIDVHPAVGDDDIDDFHGPDAVSSDGHITTENEILNAVRITAKNVQSRILHGITSDVNQFTEDYQPLESLLSLPQRKFMATWMDDHVQAAVREHLVTRLPKQLGRALLKPTTSASFAFSESEGSTTAPPTTGAVTAFLDGDASNMVTSLVHENIPSLADNKDEGLTISPQVVVGASDDEPTLSNANSLSAGSSNGSGVMQRNPSSTRAGDTVADTTTAAFPSMVLTNVLDMDLLVRLINEYCNRSRPPPADAAPVPAAVPLCNQRGRPVTLGDPISALALSTAKGGGMASVAVAADPTLELCGEYVDLTLHLRTIDRRTNSNASPNRARNANGGAGGAGAAAGSPLLSAGSWSKDGSSLIGGNLSFRSQSDACDADVSDFGGSLRSPQSPRSANATADMSQSPYAAHGSPWKERALNTETMKVHNKLMAMQEKNTLGGKEATAAAASDRRPKVLMQLLFGPLILQTYWNASMLVKLESPLQPNTSEAV